MRRSRSRGEGRAWRVARGYRESWFASKMAGTFYESGQRPMRILVAEDDVAIAEVLAYSLRKAGYTVEAVHDGESAEAQLAASQFDILILDLGLPKKSG